MFARCWRCLLLLEQIGLQCQVYTHSRIVEPNRASTGIACLVEACSIYNPAPQCCVTHVSNALESPSIAGSNTCESCMVHSLCAVHATSACIAARLGSNVMLMLTLQAMLPQNQCCHKNNVDRRSLPCTQNQIMCLASCSRHSLMAPMQCMDWNDLCKRPSILSFSTLVQRKK